MRSAFSEAVERHMRADARLLFLTGDLGYRALENLTQLGPRFLNVGVAEQSAVGIAAGLASQGWGVFLYSIAPFLAFRALEQIRIDLCFHQLPVFLVGNGGGYGYGIMGPTHHALEDLACLSCLPGMTCYVPAYEEDVEASLTAMLGARQPAYLRLGLGPRRGSLRPATGLERVCPAPQARLTVVCLGPMLHPARQATHEFGLEDWVDLWAVHRLPIPDLDGLPDSVRNTGRLLVVEEHTRRGGLAEWLCLELAAQGVCAPRFLTRSAQGYPEGRYGDQAYHREVSGLDSTSLGRLMQAECR